ALGRVERTEDVGQVVRRDAAAVVGNFDDCVFALQFNRNRDLSVGVDGLQRVKQKVQQHLMDLIAVMLDFRQGRIFAQRDLDGFGQSLLAAQHYSVFYRGI